MTVYAEIAEADSFFSGRTDAAHWQKLPAETKQSALEQASRILDESFDWKGCPASDSQNLRWPRKKVVDLDGLPVDPETVPERIRIAAMEQALYLTESVSQWLGSGIKSASVGSMSIALNAAGDRDPIAPAAVRAVRGLGTLRAAGNTAKCGSLIRG